MSIIKDEYLLMQSSRKSIDGIAETVRLDLSLNRNPHINSGTVIGIVKDLNGNSISDAVIIILDGTYAAVANTVSGSDGYYSFHTFHLVPDTKPMHNLRVFDVRSHVI